MVQRDYHKETTQWFKALNNTTERTMSRERLSLKENRENYVERKTVIKGESGGSKRLP